MELREYIRPLRKWWWLILGATLVATLSSFFATRQQPPTYSTRATVMIGSAIENPNPNGNEFWLTQQLANTYADIVGRDNVRQSTMQALGLTWLPNYTARVVANTQLIEISVIDTDPQRAQAVASELANQLIQLSPTGPGQGDAQRQEFINAQLDDLEAKIEDTRAEIARRQTELASMFSARQIADTQTQINGLQNKLSTLQANYAALLSNTQRGALNSITVIEPPALPLRPVGPNRGATVLLAAAIGFLLATGAAYLLDYLDDTLKNPDEVQKTVELTTLGAVPRMENMGPGNELMVTAEGQSAGKEAFRVLRTNLQFAAVDRPLRSLMVTSPAPSEGKSLVIANLAGAMAQAGRRAVLVDCDLHKPRLHRLFGLRNNVGLTTALLEERPALDVLLQDTAIPGLHVLTSGPLPPNPAELLGSARMREFVAELLTQFDMVLLDSPPTAVLSDAAILSTQCDGVLFVLAAGRSRREITRRAMEALRKVNARVLGAVLNQMPMQGDGYYYYYYYNYDYAGYGTDGQSGPGQNGSGRGGTKNGRRGWLRGRRSAGRSPAPEVAPLPPTRS
ncbi:MAG: Tyrosine-protein kinase YwqD [Chloroflexi bacterium ADurb.Bin325]|nr:MAG: Tyrosine-protein kinase YwqD [Chloroflexi bacterium ADurb.Bin325]